mmetsp:Transcript_42401/g.49557  ORF Transcript_42401/g.49557 Transcript_42401/m.49557 type:complete len:120 (-) Transcript_42401:83-442(-)
MSQNRNSPPRYIPNYAPFTKFRTDRKNGALINTNTNGFGNAPPYTYPSQPNIQTTAVAAASNAISHNLEQMKKMKIDTVNNSSIETNNINVQERIHTPIDIKSAVANALATEKAMRVVG